MSGLHPADDESRLTYNLALIRELGRPERITALLKDYLSDPAALAVIADRSYRHVNHFDKIVLVDTDNGGYRLTLHLWSPPYSEKELHDELIHDHRFSFWSTILTGRLVSQNFSKQESPGAVNFRQYRYSPEKLGTASVGNFYEFVGDTRLTMTDQAVESQGNAYHLQYHRIHRVALPLEAMVCTLVLRGPRERTFSNVYNTAYPSTNTQNGNVMFSVPELTEKLERLKATIERTRADA
ncbi:hypothetical protein [Kitasatospora sp. CB02891]|uniref:hypothetical protein n=1 Tax=Kitasatospora TaxID=2063 RepID=UPI0018E28163|nr:hypothetical protein [Kitasatospora sp. CB02891]